MLISLETLKSQQYGQDEREKKDCDIIISSLVYCHTVLKQFSCGDKNENEIERNNGEKVPPLN